MRSTAAVLSGQARWGVDVGDEGDLMTADRKTVIAMFEGDGSVDGNEMCDAALVFTVRAVNSFEPLVAAVRLKELCEAALALARNKTLNGG